MISFMHGYRARKALNEIETASTQALLDAYSAGFDSGLESALIVLRAQHACTGRDPEPRKWLARSITRVEDRRGSGLTH